MNILIISTNQSQSPAPVLPAGACLVAEAAAADGHQVSVLDLMFEPDPVRAADELLRTSDFDVIGLSVRNIDNNDRKGTEFYLPQLRPLVAVIRARSSALLVLGGAALTVMPEQVIRYLGADCAVIGDGEEVFRELLRRLDQGRHWNDLPGIGCLQGNRFRANASAGGKRHCAVPDYARWTRLQPYLNRMGAVPLQSKLGCAFQCVYCTYRKIEGEAYRLFDPGEVAEQARRIAARGSRIIEFVDNVFNAPREHALQVCEALIRCRTECSFLSLELNPAGFTGELLTAMERAGFAGIGLTVESASDAVLQGLGKGFSSREVHAAADLVSRHELPCVWIFMLGGPGETEATVRETLRFARTRIRPRDAAFFGAGIRIYPGTGLESIARKQGVLTAGAPEMLEPVFYVSPDVDAGWMEQQVKAALNGNLNFMSGDTFRFPYLPLVNRIGHFLGMRPPLWRHTARIRRGLRAAGVDV